MKTNHFPVVLGILFAALLSSFGPAHAAPQNAFVVNSSADTDDGTCSAQNCTLREAINAANMVAGLDTINFNIGGCPCIIYPATVLPTITDPVIINGYTESGAMPSDGQNPAVLKITVRGIHQPQLTSGLQITAGNSIIKGLALNAFPNAAIWLRDGGSNIIEGNFIGVFASGTIASPNQRGIMISHGSSGNTIGGTDPSALNLISGNTFAGIQLSEQGGSADQNVILGNLIGVDWQGNGIGNGTGIMIRTQKNRIGSTTPYTGINKIGGNLGAGILLEGSGAARNQVTYNIIGSIDDQDPGNGTYGVLIRDGASKNKIGKPGSFNYIMANGADGVAILGDTSTGNAIRGNYILQNGDMGIDLGDDGVTLNDGKDPDGGPNKRQNFPVITLADWATKRVKGKLMSAPNIRYNIDIGITPACDGNGYGESAILKHVRVTTDAEGVAKFSVLIEENIEPVWLVTAIATDAKGNTSEFSKCRPFEF